MNEDNLYLIGCQLLPLYSQHDSFQEPCDWESTGKVILQFKLTRKNHAKVTSILERGC
jgi:hypothetical protein